MTGWKVWVQKQTKGDVIVLSGNSHRSNQTLPCMTSSPKSFHSDSFPRSFCYSRCVKDFSWSELWLYRVLSHGTVCSVFTAIPFPARNVKPTSCDFQFSLPIQILQMFIPLDLLFMLGCSAGHSAEPSPQPLVCGVLWSRRAPDLPCSVLSYQECHTHTLDNSLVSAGSDLFYLSSIASKNCNFFFLFSLQNTNFDCRLCWVFPTAQIGCKN